MDRVLFGIMLIQFLSIGLLLLLVRQVDIGARKRMDDIDSKVDLVNGQLREALAAYKLEVAKSYATVGLIKDVELRLTGHLVRIEAKLNAPLQVLPKE